MTYLCRINSHSILTPLISISIDYTQYISALSTANSHSRNTLVLFVCSSIEHNKLCVSMYSSEPTRQHYRKTVPLAKQPGFTSFSCQVPNPYYSSFKLKQVIFKISFALFVTFATYSFFLHILVYFTDLSIVSILQYICKYTDSKQLSLCTCTTYLANKSWFLS